MNKATEYKNISKNKIIQMMSNTDSSINFKTKLGRKTLKRQDVWLSSSSSGIETKFLTLKAMEKMANCIYA